MSLRTTLSSLTRSRTAALAFVLVLVLSITLTFFGVVRAQTSSLSVDIISAYNLVVDSNASSPSTYAPSVATVIGRVCNNSGQQLTDVQAYIGDYNSATPSNSTPGIYPSRDSSLAAFKSEHPALADTGTYAFTHVGGQIGTTDATRYVGTLDAGQCKVQYWHFTYPQCANEPDGTPVKPACTTTPVWGDSVKPDDDLWLEFDIWAGAKDAGGSTYSDDATRRMTMRNEISAMANKIEPNPSGRWFNTNSSTIQPGDVITSNGVLYDLGNINQGFDNDGDYVYDYNAWLQPIGDPDYDPSCFRLIRTTGLLTVSRSSGKPDMVVPFQDKLYFTNLPQDNTGAIGEVHYTFLALDGPCSTSLTPYQEVASGADNEKFNGDFGGGIPPVGSSSATVTIDKTGDSTAPEGATVTYNIPFTNTSDTATAGLTLSTGGVNAPLVVSDSVPVGLDYVGNSAGYTLDYSPNNGVTIRYSTDSGNTWSTSDPGTTSSTASNRVIIQWWLNDPLPTNGNNGSGTATFQATIPGGYISGGGSPAVENCSDASFGAGSPFAEACTTTLVEGSNSIGDFVWQDDDGDGVQDGGEAGLGNVTVELYYDTDGDGTLDTDVDVHIGTTTTADGTGADPLGYYTFGQLPDGNYLVQVDSADSDVTTGYSPTTTKLYAVTLAGSDYLAADFGFGPTLDVVKRLDEAQSDPAYDGELVTYNIDLRNTLPGDGTANGSCQYTLWASTVPAVAPPDSGTGVAAFSNQSGAIAPPDGQYAFTDLSNNPDNLGLGGFNTSGQTGNITKVELVTYIKEVKNLKAGDTIILRVYQNDAQLGADSNYQGDTYFTGSAGTTYMIRQDVTSFKGSSWVWSDFSGDTTEAEIVADKGGGSGDSGDIGLDAMAYVVTTDQQCGGADSTIATLPLTDTYDSSIFDFVAAQPAPSGTSAGTIVWDNLGPLYAGGTSQVTVTLRAKATTASTINNAEVTGATFANGRDVNDGNDSATVGINTSGSIAGTIWADTDGSGWDGSTGYSSSGDTFIPNTTVQLYVCVEAQRGTLITPATAGNTGKSCTDSANNGQWQLVATQLTDSSGSYLFDGLRDGYYNVKVDEATLPATFNTHSAETDAAGNGAGSTCSGSCDGQWNTDSATLSAFNDVDNSAGADDITDVSFGYVDDSGDGAVTGYVWNDRNGDGSWDTTTEEPIANVTVELDDGSCTLGSTCASTTTDSSGFYSFGDVTPASGYQVVVTPPSGMSQSGDPDATLDNQTTSAFAVAADEIKGPYNFGYTGGLTIGDTVYADWDGDGVQDGGEEGISGVQVYLYRDVDGDGLIDAGTDTLIDTQTTDGSGLYSFANLAGDGADYIVDVNAADLPAGYAQTGDPEGNNDGMAAVTLTTSSVDTADFGYQPTGAGSIGDLVWKDSDADGTKDAGEAGISGATLNLYQDENGDGVVDAEDALIGSTTTDATGVYTFTALAAGDYIVAVDSANFNSGQPLVGLSQTNDGKNDRHAVTLAAGESYTDADFGYASSIIGDYIWQDNDGDGTQDTSEPGISGVDVTLYVDNDGDGTVSTGDTVYDYDGDSTPGSAGDTIQTDADGRYEFGSLPAGDYVVVVENSNFGSGGALENYTLTYDPDAYSTNAGKPFPPCDPNDSDYTDCDNQSGATGLSLGQTDRTHDFGYQPQGVVGDYVWFDANGDGVQDATETGISGAVVTITLSSGPVYTTTTDSDGYYSFGNLPDGTHTVEVDASTLPAGVTPSYDKDSATSGPDGQSTVTLSGGNTVLDVDFGYTYSGAESISGHVFFDATGDGGTYGAAGDAPYEGITVYLWNSAGTLVGTTTTASDGSYNFAGLPASSFTVSIDRNAPQVSAQTLTATPSESGTCTACNAYNTVTASASNQDFGFYASMDFGDLLDSYDTKIVDEGPYHTIGSLYLGDGSAPDSENDGQPNSTATGDGADEDGVNRDLNDRWTPGTTVDLFVDVTGSGGYLVGWFDWNGDGDFADAGEITKFGTVSSGSNTLSLQVPGSGYTQGDIVNARFRLYDGQPATISPTGGATNGEVEDYQWDFADPTIVTLTNAQTDTHGAGSRLPYGLVAGLVVAAGYLILRSRRRRSA